MKNEIKKIKSFDITTFETLDSEGKTLLKGGFSVVYDENQAYTGGFSILGLGDITINVKSGCQCTNTCNQVAGCGCTGSTPTTA